MKTSWYIAGLHFECIQCSHCCSGPQQGFIWITAPEIKFLADFLKISVKQLRQKYLMRIGIRKTIIEDPTTKDCIFLKNIDGRKKCSIYPVRPNQCRTWPFWSDNLTTPSAWNHTAKKCSGINRGKFYSFSKIEKIRKSKKWWDDGEK